MSTGTGRFTQSDRLRDSRDYRRVMRSGRRKAHRDLVVIIVPRVGTMGSARANSAAGALRAPPEDLEKSNKNKILPSRLGVTVSRKVGNAVCRNRFKRRMREWFRLHRSELDPAIDLVVIARRSGGELSLSELDQRLAGLLPLSRTSSSPVVAGTGK